MLIELGRTELRHQAVLEALGGIAVNEVARRYGVTRQTLHRWLRRYAREGVAGLADSTSRPGSCPHQMTPETEARIVAMRRKHPAWGPRTISHYLACEDPEAAPSRSAVYRALVRHGLVEAQRQRRHAADYRRWERSRPMELWQMDVMGGVKLDDGRELKIVTGIDDHSRYCVCALLTPRATARPVCDALLGALQRHGIPEQILTDNGKVFTGRFGRGKGEVLFDRICRENGIRHLLTAPRSPTTTGKVERFHKTLRAELLEGRRFTSLAAAREALEVWCAHYNELRPHQGIGMVPPARRFELASEPPAPIVRPAPRVSAPADPPAQRQITRRVGKGGRISLEGYDYRVGVWLAGQNVEVTLTPDGLVEVWHRGVLIASHARRRTKGGPAVVRQPQAGRPARAHTAGQPILRMVDKRGSLSFAGSAYHVGSRYAAQQVEVRLVGATVEISQRGKLIRTYAAKHDRSKEHGAFATPGGRPHKKESDRNDQRPDRNRGAEAKL
jgi:transposase InsO family protein